MVKTLQGGVRGVRGVVAVYSSRYQRTICTTKKQHTTYLNHYTAKATLHALTALTVVARVTGRFMVQYKQR